MLLSNHNCFLLHHNNQLFSFSFLSIHIDINFILITYTNLWYFHHILLFKNYQHIFYLSKCWKRLSLIILSFNHDRKLYLLFYHYHFLLFLYPFGYFLIYIGHNFLIIIINHFLLNLLYLLYLLYSSHHLHFFPIYYL
jgi:hypothetical protein